MITIASRFEGVVLYALALLRHNCVKEIRRESFIWKAMMPLLIKKEGAVYYYYDDDDD